MQHFIDEAFITVTSGNGGAGCVSFRREKFIPYGGPDGGNGGEGGSVVFIVKENLRTLYNLKLKRTFTAKNGLPGMGSQRDGKKGDDVIIYVPPGTVIYDKENNQIIRDFKKKDEVFILLKGGKGGKGNMHFATSTNQAPRYAQPGIHGSQLVLRVELKLIADIGLVGFPNAGKSTLLSVISKAKPKIANYPFTTLIPNLGVVVVDDESFVVADIPGIIEGASNGAGLGIKFLKHIERTKILLYLINLEDEDYLNQFKKLKDELYLFSKKMKDKPFMIVASKIDIEDGKSRYQNLKKEINEEILTISSITRYGIKELLYKIKDRIKNFEDTELE